jgi:serine/threonine protein kinase/pSer/pThr/pTyr-binding forkhead associated (FHA) protein
MLQTPRVAFRDPRLRACRVEKNAMGQPRPWAGAFAVVYKGIDADDRRPFAIRVFSSESAERRERYDRIAEYLRDRNVGCMVAFEYRDEAVRSAGDGKWYPLVTMDWVEGPTLLEYVRARCLTGRVESVAKAARHWVALVEELASAEIAHGDLQHANILVTREGRLKLVDYDGMCVPELVGRRNLELGVPPYQHPQRNGDTRLSLDLDNFSALLIYAALRALAAEPGLWARHVQQSGYDKLLFRREDFADRKASSLYADLKNSPDREVRRLARILWAAAAADMKEVPRLEEVFGSTHPLPVSQRKRGDFHAASSPSERGDTDHAAPQVILEVVAGPIEGKQFVFDRHDTFLFGRSKDCHARISGDPRVSRHHFLLEALPPQARIRDLGSRNGTFVNGVKHGGREAGEDAEQASGKHHPEVELRHGDRINVGHTAIRVVIRQPVALAVREAADDLPQPFGPPQGRAGKPEVPGYRIQAEIGRGRLGTVYKAVREADGRPVALRIVMPRVAAGEDEYHAALVAIDRVRPLRHPHMAALLESGLVGRSLYFATDYCDGGNLRQWVNQRGGWRSFTEVGPLLVQCLAALEYAHAHDVIHRSINPQNVLLASEGGQQVAKITDFALTHNLEVVSLAGMMATGEFHVDYHFLPREQLTDFRACSSTSDLWSLAATFYQTLSGQFPYDFSGRDPIEVILHDDPKPLCESNPVVPKPIADVIDRALATDPGQRYQTAAEMKASLEGAFSELAGYLR